MHEFTLYSYFRSSSSYRVRIALNLKGISYQYIPVHLLHEGGEQHKAVFRQLNPRAEVPLLVHREMPIAQSMAIIQYLDDIQPEVRLFPKSPLYRAQVIQFCEIINSGIQPLQNLSVLQFLKNNWKLNDQSTQDWASYWIENGFNSLEKTLQKTAGTFCFGGEITAADVFLVPQAFSAQRFGVDIKTFPIIHRIVQTAEQIEGFRSAHPLRQIDSPPA